MQKYILFINIESYLKVHDKLLLQHKIWLFLVNDLSFI